MKDYTTAHRWAMIPNLEKPTAENYWQWRLHCIWERASGRCDDVSDTLNRLYNFDEIFSLSMKSDSFIHEFCHLLYGLVLHKIFSNPRYSEISIPFEHPANGNHLSEAFADTIEDIILYGVIGDDFEKSFVQHIIRDYARTFSEDMQRNIVAVSVVDETQKFLSIFAASRQSHFEERSPRWTISTYPEFTKWGERVELEINKDDLSKLITAVLPIIRPIINYIHEEIEKKGLKRECDEEMRAVVSEYLKGIQFENLRKMVQGHDHMIHNVQMPSSPTTLTRQPRI